jgi:hypothetical protein
MPTSSSPNISPLSTPSDLDAFSVISYCSDKDKAFTPEESPITDLCGHSFTQAGNDPTSYLASIVEHGINLCETRRSLEEGILKGLERHERLYLDAIESSKNSLAMTRRNAADIVARFKGASGGIVSINLPWLDRVETGAYGSERQSHCPTPINFPLVPAFPMDPPLPGPGPITGAPNSTLDTNSPALTMYPTTVVDHRVSSVPLIHRLSSVPLVHIPLSPLPQPVVPSLKPTPASSLPPFTGSVMEAAHTPSQYDSKHSILSLADSPTGAGGKGGKGGKKGGKGASNKSGKGASDKGASGKGAGASSSKLDFHYPWHHHMQGR